MLIVVDRQCDANVEGGRKALFPGQRYDLPEAEAERLIGTKHVRAVRSAGQAFTATEVRAKGRPQAKD